MSWIEQGFGQLNTVRAFPSGITKLCNLNTSKNLLYYFTILFYNTPFITCSIL